MAIILFSLVIIIICFPIFKNLKNAKENTELKLQYNRLPEKIGGFKMDKSYKNGAGLSLIAMDDAKKKLLLARKLEAHQVATLRKFDKKAYILKHKIVAYKDILRSELIINNKTVNVKSASGLQTGCVKEDKRKAHSNRHIKNVRLKFILNDLDEPAFTVTFYNSSVKKVSPVSARKECERWHESVGMAMAN